MSQLYTNYLLIIIYSYIVLVSRTYTLIRLEYSNYTNPLLLVDVSQSA